MSKKPMTFWFVEPLDDRTNKVFSEETEARVFTRNVSCADGKSHPLWECTHLESQRFEDCKTSKRLRFRTWKRAGPNGKIVLWKFGRR